MGVQIRQVALLGLMAAGFVCSVAVHEAGHAVACSHFGHDTRIVIDFDESSTYCEATELEDIYVRAGGGLSLALALPLFVPSIRRNVYARFFLLAPALSNLMYVPVETFLKDWYGGIILVSDFGTAAYTDIILTSLAIAGISVTLLAEWFKFESIRIKKR